MTEYKCTCGEDLEFEAPCVFAMEMATPKQLEDQDFLNENMCSCCDYCRDQCAQEI